MTKLLNRNFRQAKPYARPSQPLADRLTEQLYGYSIATTAAGVALLACSLPADAAPVCGSLSVTLNFTDTYAFNPAHQKIAPFNVAHTYNDASSHPGSRRARAFFTPNTPDAKVLTSVNGLPMDLASGATVGSKATFGGGKEYGLLNGYYYFNRYLGNFPADQSGYLGFHFSESGQTHYGWLRVRVTKLITQGPSLELSEFGYESSPNTAIAAGSCAASSSSAAPESNPPEAISAEAQKSNPLTLGMLALGSKSLQLRRSGFRGDQP